MPWTETEGRLQLLRDALSDRFTMSELCARYGVSRRVRYEWLARYEAEGRAELQHRSRAPHQCPHHIAKPVKVLLLTERQAHAFRGARRLLKVLETRYPKFDRWPAASTAADLLARHGLVQKRRRYRASVHPGVVRPTTATLNDAWTADFKGPVCMGNRVDCYPLTIADQHNRFFLDLRGLLSTQTVTAKPVFERMFREYGLPIAIRIDNGVPFAT